MAEISTRPSKLTGWRHFLSTFANVANGLRACFVHEAAFRQEMMLLTVVIAVMIIPLPRVSLLWRLVPMGLWLLVLIVELLNTAIEAIVDFVSPGWSQAAKYAKDCGAAAVFLALMIFFAYLGGLGLYSWGILG